MTSILAKLRIVTLGNLHDLLDAVIDINSLAAVKQYARDLEGGIAQIEEAFVVARGSLTTTDRDIKTAAGLAKELDSDINALLGDNDAANDKLALPLQVRYDATIKRGESLKALRDERQQTADRLEGAISKLRAKHEDMLGEIKRLEALEEGREGMDAASKAAKQAGQISVDTPSVDNTARRIQARYDKSAARFDRAMSEVESSTENSEAVSSAEAALVERKARLDSKKKKPAAK